jgi:hypothetical protein
VLAFSADSAKKYLPGISLVQFQRGHQYLRLQTIMMGATLFAKPERRAERAAKGGYVGR